MRIRTRRARTVVAAVVAALAVTSVGHTVESGSPSDSSVSQSDLDAIVDDTSVECLIDGFDQLVGGHSPESTTTDEAIDEVGDDDILALLDDCEVDLLTLLSAFVAAMISDEDVDDMAQEAPGTIVDSTDGTEPMANGDDRSTAEFIADTLASMGVDVTPEQLECLVDALSEFDVTDFGRMTGAMGECDVGFGFPFGRG